MLGAPQERWLDASLARTQAGPEPSTVDGWVRKIRTSSTRRYLHLTATPQCLEAELIAVDDPLRADSAPHTAATFHAADGRPGVVS